MGINIFNTLKSEEKEEKWSQIEHYLKNDIPLLRFFFKVIEGYPNADRNLNLEAFENKVLTQDL
jgi:hypothetical protein